MVRTNTVYGTMPKSAARGVLRDARALQQDPPAVHIGRLSADGTTCGCGRTSGANGVVPTRSSSSRGGPVSSSSTSAEHVALDRTSGTTRDIAREAFARATETDEATADALAPALAVRLAGRSRAALASSPKLTSRTTSDIGL
jgi:hypothetical protein